MTVGLFLWSLISAHLSAPLPEGFVYLETVAPTIKQDMRYAGSHNFTGQPVPGYKRPRCILTRPTAKALADAAALLARFGLGIKVYDCYRPARAVRAFAAWAEQPVDHGLKQEFYPDLAPSDAHKLGYIAHQSGHSRGSTVDLTLTPLDAPDAPRWQNHQPLVACTAPAGVRFLDSSIDMGTGFDCLHPRAHTECPTLPAQARQNRLLLREVMRRFGLINYPKEWWHYTYYNEPYRQTYFDFDVL